jgi:hypothetical protein
MTAQHLDEVPSRYLAKVDALMSDRKKFDQFVYTPLEEALVELKQRQDNKDLDAYIEENLLGEIPEMMREKRGITLFRHIATPNHEIRRFIGIADLVQQSFETSGMKLRPLILEYLDDMFTNRNEWKYSLGRIYLYKGLDKKTEPIFESFYIIDFNDSNSKPISSLKTTWGQHLVDFHHELFQKVYPHLQHNVFDLSSWVKGNGKNAKAYYKSFLSLFLKHGVLLENFLIETTEGSFTRRVILPALLEIEEECGFKPLIVALEPTEAEHQRFWLSHPHEETHGVLKEKLKGVDNRT